MDTTWRSRWGKSRSPYRSHSQTRSPTYREITQISERPVEWQSACFPECVPAAIWARGQSGKGLNDWVSICLEHETPLCRVSLWPYHRPWPPPTYSDAAHHRPALCGSRSGAIGRVRRVRAPTASASRAHCKHHGIALRFKRCTQRGLPSPFPSLLAILRRSAWCSCTPRRAHGQSYVRMRGRTAAR